MSFLCDKRIAKYVTFCLFFCVLFSLVFSLLVRDKLQWFSLWFSDKFYSYIICTLYLLGDSIIEQYFNLFAYSRICSRRKFVACNLAHKYLFAFILNSMIFSSILTGCLLKFKEFRTDSAEMLAWYFKYFA
jgi:hypothetical protein